jgi:two-component sensor histidine kinase
MRITEAWADSSATDLDFVSALRTCGAQGEAISAFDWSTTPLGPIDAWPEWMRTLVLTVAASPHPMSLRLGPHLTTIFNEAFIPMLGERAKTALGKRFDEIWPELFEEVLPWLKRALAGEAVSKTDTPLTMTRNGFAELTYWTFAYTPVRDPRGRVVGILNLVDETTEAVRTRAEIVKAHDHMVAEVENARRALIQRDEAERQQRVLKHELIHRMKNMLAVISSIVSHSILSARSVPHAAEVTAARLAAYARVQEVFSEGAWSDADLHEVVAAAIAPHLDGITFNGPPIRLNAQHSLAIALAIHELATNAVKYGALSNGEGRIAVQWCMDDDRFVFDWHEQDGPATSPPEEKGFGSILTDRIVPAYFSGRAIKVFDQHGLRYTLDGQIVVPDTP